MSSASMSSDPFTAAEFSDAPAYFANSAIHVRCWLIVRLLPQLNRCR
jgi:hypothetical protein